MALIVTLIIAAASPAAAQLAGADTSPGDSCAGYPAGATRVTADADQDGAEVVLICDGSTWRAALEPAADPGRGIQFNSGGALTANSDFRYTVDGYVGIGTDSPSTRLHLNTDSSSEWLELNLTNTSTDSGGTVLGLDAHGKNSYLWNRDGELYLGTTDNERLRIDSAGRVGIGTDDPQVLLHVGDGDDTSGAPLLVLSEDGSGQPAMNLVDYGNDITALGITDDDYFAIATEDTQDGIQFRVDGNWTTDMLNTAPPAMTITTAGNVGIGTADPEAALDVAGAVKVGTMATCDDDREGAIRYTGGDPPWEYCDGEAWVNFKQPRCQDDDIGECYLDSVRDNDDPDFIAANIANGVNVLGVTGTFTGGCVAPTSCQNVGDVCDDGDGGTVNDPIFAGFMVYNDPNSMDFGVCKPLYVTNDNNEGLDRLAWKTSTGSDDITTDSTEDGKINHANLGAGTFPAFEACENLNDGGFNDWYLPARVELNLLWMNQSAINTGAIGNFEDAGYWSSTEYDTEEAWYQHFRVTRGDQRETDKTNVGHIRCVRRDPASHGGGPTGCPSVGDECSDGTVYAGQSPDGDVPMYTTPCDYGMTWDGTNCTGSREKKEYGSRGTSRGTTSQIDGDGNTATLAAFGQTAHPAAYACAELEAHGHTDWYLPSEEEQEELYDNKSAIGNFDSSGGNRWYISSSEYDSTDVHAEIWSNGTSYNEWKDTDLTVRCVRQE